MTDMPDRPTISFVRTETIPPAPPPAAETGAIKWLRENLFSSIPNTILTLVSLYVIFWLLSGLIPWLANGVWDATSIRDCREQLQGAVGGCFAVIAERWPQLLFGSYPKDILMRPTWAFLLLVVAIAPVLFTEIPKKILYLLSYIPVALILTVVFGGGVGLATLVLVVFALGYLVFARMEAADMSSGFRNLLSGDVAVPRKLLYFTGLYPFIGYWLIWGGSMWVPITALAGIAAGYVIFSKLEGKSFFGALSAAIVGTILFWTLLGGPIISALSSVAPLEMEFVESRLIGGFMINFILGVVCITLSLPLGILLALGRQSDLPIIKGICVVFIEFVRGVPLITLLFVASVMLAYFLPPGTNFDLILRVIIMITLFAAAYIAEAIRGGLAALPKGQYEAGDSLGLDYWQSMRLIILPQALKISIPSIVNIAIGLFKDTTLVSIISMFDLLGIIRGPILATTEWFGIYWELLGFSALMFFVICFGISKYSQYLERKLATDRR